MQFDQTLHCLPISHRRFQRNFCKAVSIWILSIDAQATFIPHMQNWFCRCSAQVLNSDDNIVANEDMAHMGDFCFCHKVFNSRQNVSACGKDLFN